MSSPSNSIGYNSNSEDSQVPYFSVGCAAHAELQLLVTHLSLLQRSPHPPTSVRPDAESRIILGSDDGRREIWRAVDTVVRRRAQLMQISTSVMRSQTEKCAAYESAFH